MARSAPRDVLAWTSICTGLLLAAFAVFASQRTVTYVAPSSLLASGNSTTSSSPDTSYAVNATRLVLACEAACGGAPTCRQSYTTGIVVANGCTSCGPGYTLFNGTCQIPSTCGQWPYCSTNDSVRVAAVHNAMVTAVVNLAGNNITLVPHQYPATPAGLAAMQNSSNWTTVLQPVFGTPLPAVQLLNLFLTAKFSELALGSSLSPLLYVDDQAGYWHASLGAYQQILPANYVAYVTDLKQLLCARTWLQAGASCAAPAL